MSTTTVYTKVKDVLLLDLRIGEGPTILKLFAGEKTCRCLAGRSLDEDLHAAIETQH